MPCPVGPERGWLPWTAAAAAAIAVQGDGAMMSCSLAKGGTLEALCGREHQASSLSRPESIPLELLPKTKSLKFSLTHLLL